MQALVLLRGLGEIAVAQVILRQSLARELLVDRIAAGRDLVHQRLQQLDRFLGIVIAIGENAAVELRLFGRQLVQLRLHAEVLVIGEQVLDARIARQPAAGAGVHLRVRSGFLLRGGAGRLLRHKRSRTSRSRSMPRPVRPPCELRSLLIEGYQMRRFIGSDRFLFIETALMYRR